MTTAGPTSTSPSDSTAAILYRNNRDGTFTDVALESGTAYNEHGNSTGRDGRGDRRRQRRWAARPVEDALRRRHPSLYRALGKGLFEDVAVACRPRRAEPVRRMGRRASRFRQRRLADVLYVTGHVYPEVERVLPSTRIAARRWSSATSAAAGSKTSRPRAAAATASHRAGARRSATSTTTATSTSW